MKLKEGDQVKSDFDGDDFIITRIVKGMVILKSRTGKREILTGIGSLGIPYGNKGKNQLTYLK
jgi:hypothetical protein